MKELKINLNSISQGAIENIFCFISRYKVKDFLGFIPSLSIRCLATKKYCLALT